MKRIGFVVFMLLIFCGVVQAQNYTLPLWEDEIPNYRDAGVTEQADTSNMVRISQVQNPDIAVYLPTRANATGQAVIICPGGGYGILAYDWEGTDMAKWLNSNGIAGIVLKYRLPDSATSVVRHRSPLLDAQQAMRLTRNHAEEWGIDPDQVGVMGFSAGGHLASTLGTHNDTGNPDANNPMERISSRPDFMVLVYPVVTFDEEFTHMGSRNNLIGNNPDQALIDLYSNEKQVTSDTPPTFLIHAGDDTVVPVQNSLLFYQALQEHGVPSELHVYPEGGHGFSFAMDNEHLRNWTDACIKWLETLE